METPIAVANYFIKRSLETEMSVTPMKLVKLVYIAHGWNLALTDEPLITEGVEAWKYGPVVPEVYHTFKQYGDNSITKLEVIPYVVSSPGASEVLMHEFRPPLPAPESIPLLNRVWDLYKEFDGLQLSTLTHKKDTPWWKVWYAKTGAIYEGVLIPNDVIKEYYKSKLIKEE